jgi:hypothetical protein
MDWDVVNDAGLFLWANNRSEETGCIPDNGVARGCLGSGGLCDGTHDLPKPLATDFNVNEYVTTSQTE